MIHSACANDDAARKAAADFDEAIRLDPKDAAAYHGRGLLRRDRQDFDQAIADLNEAIRLDRGNAEIYGGDIATCYDGRGSARLSEGKYDEAIADFTESIRLDPGDPSTYSNRGDAWYRKERLRPGHRRLQPGHPARSHIRGCLPLPRLRLGHQGPARQGHR